MSMLNCIHMIPEFVIIMYTSVSWITALETYTL